MMDKLINKFIEINAILAHIKDLDILLEKILLNARKIVNADAGSIYIKDGNDLKFIIAQNDTMSKRLPEGKKLIFSTFSVPINNSTISGYVANTGNILKITDAYTIPDTEPYSFGKKFDEISNYRTKSILTIPLKTHIGEIIGVIQIINAMDDDNNIIEFKDDLLPVMDFFANSAAIAIERARMTREIILRMIKMAEMRDPKETGAHVNRVGAYTIEIYEAWAKKKNISDSEIEKNIDILRIAAMLHDVGKVAISDTILKKPGKFEPDEFEIMKSHTFIGAGLFKGKSSELDAASMDVALNHHEKWNGKGYPGFVEIGTGKLLDPKCTRPKKADEIPLYGRIVAIADVFDALSSARVYKEAWDEEKVIRILKEERGEHFDPELIDSFFSVYDNIKAIGERYV